MYDFIKTVKLGIFEKSFKKNHKFNSTLKMLRVVSNYYWTWRQNKNSFKSLSMNKKQKIRKLLTVLSFSLYCYHFSCSAINHDCHIYLCLSEHAHSTRFSCLFLNSFSYLPPPRVLTVTKAQVLSRLIQQFHKMTFVWLIF